MHRFVRYLIAAAALMFAVPVQTAAQTLVVEGLVSPAWLERAGAREPLAAGQVLAGTDAVLTGSGGRALLRMAEGSALKLGENARLEVNALSEKKDAERRLVTAALDVARGAFRFTTGVFAGSPAGRDVRVRVSAVTAGIRGTDVWGKSEPERDIVCLITGAVEVEHGGQQFRMQEPLSFYVAPRTGEPAPVAPVSREQVDLWSEETEIRSGSGGMRRDGRYGVEVMAGRDPAAAQQARDALRADGYAAALESTQDGYGVEVHRVHIRGAASADDASMLARRLRALGYPEAAAR